MKSFSASGGGSVTGAPDTLVSIAVPVHNGARYLGDTLESIVRQTHESLEIVVVDDASADNSLALAESFARRDGRVKVLHNARNMGMVGNWNRTVAACSGQWIHLTGQDDLLAPDAIESALGAAAPDTRLIMAARRFAFEIGCPSRLRFTYVRELPTLETLDVLPGIVTPDAVARLMSRLPSPCTNFLGEPVCGLVRRDVFRERGLFHGGLAQLADYEFWLRCFLQEPFMYVARPLFTFRVHGRSATAVNLADNVRGVHLEYASLLLELLEGERHAGARARHGWLAPLWEDALLREILVLQRCAGRNARAAEAIAAAAGSHPGLARRMEKVVSSRQRMRIALDGLRVQMRRLGPAGFGRHLRLRPHSLDDGRSFRNTSSCRS